MLANAKSQIVLALTQVKASLFIKPKISSLFKRALQSVQHMTPFIHLKLSNKKNNFMLKQNELKVRKRNRRVVELQCKDKEVQYTSKKYKVYTACYKVPGMQLNAAQVQFNN